MFSTTPNFGRPSSISPSPASSSSSSRCPLRADLEAEFESAVGLANVLEPLTDRSDVVGRLRDDDPERAVDRLDHKRGVGGRERLEFDELRHRGCSVARHADELAVDRLQRALTERAKFGARDANPASGSTGLRVVDRFCEGGDLFVLGVWIVVSNDP